MFNLTFADKKKKKLYDKIKNENYFIEEILEQLLLKYPKIMVDDILLTKKGFQILLSTDDDKIVLTCDYIECKTYLFCDNWNCKIIYSNVIKKNYVPIGREYRKDNHKVLWYYSDTVNPHKYKYEFLDGSDKTYEINIHKDKPDGIDDYFIINNLLDDNTNITRIKDLLVLLNGLIDLGTCELKIKDNDDKESSIIVYNGVLTRYVEYMEDDNSEYKIYLENGEFYKDTITREELQESPVSFVKKKGKRYE